MRWGLLENVERLFPRIYEFLKRGSQRIGLRISKVKLIFWEWKESTLMWFSHFWWRWWRSLSFTPARLAWILIDELDWRSPSSGLEGEIVGCTTLKGSRPHQSKAQRWACWTRQLKQTSIRNRSPLGQWCIAINAIRVKIIKGSSLWIKRAMCHSIERVILRESNPQLRIVKKL